jgi:type IV secretory pathway TraG/TraD family ATPase VirD4
MTAFVMAALMFLVWMWGIYQWEWSPVWRYWLPQYVWTSWSGQKTANMRVLTEETPDGKQLWPLEEDVESGETQVAPDGAVIGLRLTEQAAKEGRRLYLRPKQLLATEWMHEQLKQHVYAGNEVSDLLKDMAYSAMFAAFGTLLLGLMFAVPMDRENRRIRKYGRRVKGPELVTAAEFNRRNQSDGIGFLTSEPRKLKEILLRREGKMVRIPRERESAHVMAVGDTGSGKTSLIRGSLVQIEQRGETAIVYDPALEFTPQFYDPARGDVILNPLDARMPYWSPCDEVQHEAEAEGLAAALFKDDPRSNPFFVTVPRQIFAHLLTEKPKRTPQELLAILRDERELAKRLKDTEHAAAIYPEAGPQRGGMLATLNMVTNALKLLPSQQEAKTRWTALEWSQPRQGWVFITSPPEFRERLRPLISMWLDMLILRTMNQGRPGVCPVWFVLDELQSLHALPQLHTAITESRKAKNPIILGFQGRSQMEELYGRKAEAMLSQAATKIFLRTSEPHAAQWISATIGKQEIERLKESRMAGHFPNQRESHTVQVESVVEPLVMDSEIQGLEDRQGYLKSGNLVVRVSFPYIELPKRHEAFIERKLTPQQMKEDRVQQATASAGATGQVRNMPPPIPPQVDPIERPNAAGEKNKTRWE